VALAVFIPLSNPFYITESNKGIIMFEIITTSCGNSVTATFDTLEKAQAWLEACALAYSTATFVINFNRNI
jgi:hypothetical protein